MIIAAREGEEVTWEYHIVIWTFSGEKKLSQNITFLWHHPVNLSIRNGLV